MASQGGPPQNQPPHDPAQDQPRQPGYGTPPMPSGQQLPGDGPGFWSPQQPPPWTGQPQQQPYVQQQPPYPPQQPPHGQPPYGGQQPYGSMPYNLRPPEQRQIPAPPGTPFHQLARNARHRWWRPIIGTVTLAVGAFILTAAVVVAWSVVHRMITGDLPAASGDEIFANDLENLASTLVMLAILTPTVAFTVWAVQRRPPWSVASVLNKIRWKWLFLACLPALGYLVLSYAFGLLAAAIFPDADPVPADDGAWVGFAAFIGPALLLLCLVPFQSAAEEFVFRGWLIQAVGAYAPRSEARNAVTRAIWRALRTPWPALVVSSAVFVSAHGYTGWAMADIFLFAMTVGWLTVRTGGIEAAIALHVLNNLLAFLLPAATGQLDGWADQGGAPWTLLLTDIPSLAFFAVSVTWLARRRKVATVSQ
ncbi:CPBP family glutamic-type intramembrane protease [Kribbella sp. DT2]|uniref:CPBP family glutamic-type intramembrane protease n=1 Tax=Kribbella sp. DT2 TaxID=3393427 RepID=UPI003CE7340A